MNKGISLLASVIVGGIFSIYTTNTLAATHYAYIVDTGYQVHYVSSTGESTVKSKPYFALSVSATPDGGAWAVSTDSGDRDRGGNLLKLLPKGSTEWKTIAIEGDIEVSRVSSDFKGNAYVIDGETQQIHHIDTTGKILKDYVDETPFFSVSAAFTSNSPINNQLWGVCAKPDGKIDSPLYYKVDDQDWRKRGLGARAISGYWMISDEGRVVMAGTNNTKPQPKSPRDMASSISVSRSGTIWVVSQEPNMQKGGAMLKIWDAKGIESKNWITVPNIGATSVSAL
ncbi:hypothetical protein GCM10008090_24060 [Arenicella chitinivorans]|uniref:Uncharacterized protein n=1 Tax=Arenicella chitinivorans TaxID=1329800 RepID=A0A918RUT4_9GAMM|nr:hypothetical protein [Arenicella chitinivorans]GHA13512.1 hypothetical protein GCM10008090_24060 [Arenicella chitinivorans]